LYKSENYKSNNQEHKRIVNEIANRAFLTKKANLRASNAYPEKYLPKVLENYPQALKSQFIPDNSDLWNIENYEDFIKERRKKLASAINDFMDNLLQEEKSKIIVENVNNLIKNGESETVEFKSSLRWDSQQKNINKLLGKVIVKTLAGFLNANGGKLIIGVDDNGNIIGLDNDYKTLKKMNRDGYELFLTQLYSQNIGKEFYQYIHITFHDFNGKDVCLISIESSSKPVYVKDGNEEKFFLRTGNSTQQLNAKETVFYASSHWTKE
ncbi:putative DNA binding domain-containing protein, partial [Desulfobacterales bacterium HSG17]|nr:putative DNA binding domain-containing protein [Desulfobacterales bacterium HSG17]